MHSYPTDLGPAITALVSALAALVTIYRLLGCYQSRIPRLRLLTGTRPQRAALLVALAPVLGPVLRIVC